MDREGSLLAEIALRMTRSPEDVATESLAYVFSRSETALRRLQRLAEDWASGPLRPIVAVRSQVRGDDESRPDLEAQDAGGTPVVIFENKFWAALTDAQPVAYLQRLEHAGGVLCCVAPETRMGFLWTELVDRVRKAMPENLQVLRDEPRLKLAKVGDRTVLVLTSWTFLLDEVRISLEESGESALAGDVRQIIGLATRMDTVGFLPLTDADLSGSTPRHVLQFCNIVDDMVQMLLRGAGDESAVSKRGLKSSAGAGWYGHYLWIHGHGCQLLFTAWWWRDHPRNPIWLRLANATWQYPERAEHAVMAKFGRDRCVERRSGYGPGIWVPIDLRTGRELEEVVRDATAQVLDVADALRPFATQPAPDAVLTEPDQERSLGDNDEIPG